MAVEFGPEPGAAGLGEPHPHSLPNGQHKGVGIPSGRTQKLPKEPGMSRKSLSPNDAQERNTEIALFRYGLISALLFDPLAAGQLEQALRAIAAKTYAIPYSRRTRVSVSSLRRYLQLFNQGGFEALRPGQRSDKGVPRAFPPEVLEKAIALREEQPARTTSMLVDILEREGLKLERPLNAHTLTSQLRGRGKTR